MKRERRCAYVPGGAVLACVTPRGSPMLQREAVAGFAMGESCGPRYDDNARLNPLSAPLRTLARRSKCGTGIGSFAPMAID